MMKGVPTVTLRQNADGIYTAESATYYCEGKNPYELLGKHALQSQTLNVEYGKSERTILKDSELDGRQMILISKVKQAHIDLAGDNWIRGLNDYENGVQEWNCTWPESWPEEWL